MTRTEAARLVQPFYNAFATGDIAALDAVFDPAWQDRTLPPNRPQGLVGLKGALGFLRGTLPDLTATVEDVLVDQDFIVVRLVFHGTNLGGLPQVPPNQQQVSFLAFDWHHVIASRIVESWHLEDNLSLMTRLGAVPSAG